MSYEHNIFWSDIPKDAQIYDLGHSWVVHMPDGRKGLVYWTGETAGKAQAMLKMRALSKDKMPKEACKKWRWDGMPGETCSCGAPKSDHKRTRAEQRVIDASVKQFKAEHPEVYDGKASGVCTIVCKFPRRR